MFRTVLLPLDGSPLAETALGPLQRLLHEVDDACVHLLHVSSGDDAEAPDWSRVEARCAEWGLRVERHEAKGDPAQAILAQSEALAPDLILMATHGRSGLRRVVRGSVAEAVLREAPAPLLLVNPHHQQRIGESLFRKILVPLDGSPRGDEVLPFVIAVARSVGSEVTLLRIEPIEPYMAEGPPFTPPVTWSPDSVCATLEPQVQRLLDARVDATSEARIGDAAAEISAAAKDFDLVALTTHGRSGLARLVFGSVAEEILREVERPVLVLRSKR